MMIFTVRVVTISEVGTNNIVFLGNGKHPVDFRRKKTITLNGAHSRNHVIETIDRMRVGLRDFKNSRLNRS